MDREMREDLARLLLRVSFGMLLLLHGIAKLDPGAVGWIGDRLSQLGLPELLAYGVYVGELIAPIMIVAGIFCRIGAALVVINMLFAVALAHGAELLRLNENGGYALELQVMYLVAALVLALTGSGRFAVRPD